MHIGTASDMDPTDGTSMVATLIIPTATGIPSWSASVDNAANGIDLSEIWIDADVSGEEVLVSYIEA
jgi:hypothetical protein